MKKKENSAGWMLAKVNLGIFVLIMLPSILYVRHIALSSRIWSAKLPIVFLVVLTFPFIALATVGILSSIINLFHRKKRAMLSFAIHLLLLIIYILLVSGNLTNFLVG